MPTQAVSFCIVVTAVVGVILFVAALDSWLWLWWGREHSISSHIQRLYVNWPLWVVVIPSTLLFFVGVYVGHQFVPMGLPKDAFAAAPDDGSFRRGVELVLPGDARGDDL